MEEIYSLAQSVYVWFGDGDKETDIAMDYIERAGFQQLLVKCDDGMHYVIPNRSFARKVLLFRALNNISWRVSNIFNRK